jgi:hypothetical protein
MRDPGPISAEEAAQFREMAYRLAGGARPEPWWQESHGRIIARARALTWPARLVDVETQVCELVGDEFFDRLDSPEGSPNGQWLRSLAEKAGTALRAEAEKGGGDWEQLWALLCGLALTTPQPPVGEVGEAVRRVRAEFPGIKDPYDVAMAEVDRAVKLLVDHGLEAGDGELVGCRSTGEALLARDVYGGRFLLAAPFGYEEGEADHWYAWDVDTCWFKAVVGAGVFGSAEDALSEWRDAVGAAASAATLSPCPSGWPSWLLRSCLQVGPVAEMLTGIEPRELLREYYRMRRRARVLNGYEYDETDSLGYDAGYAHEAFLDWYATRHHDSREAVSEAAAAILTEWTYDTPDQHSFYACSPHRIEMTARQIRDAHDTDCAGRAVELFPEWTRWCIEQSGLDGDAAARALEAAQSVAVVPARDASTGLADEGEEQMPFRRNE